MFPDAVVEALKIRFHHHLSAHVAVSAGLALASALAFAVAIVAQQRAAERVPDEHARSGRLIAHLFRSRQWIAGTVSNTLGYCLQASALAYGSLLIVQPILVTSLLFAMPLEARLARARPPRSQWAWAVALAAGLAIFVTTGNPNHGADHGDTRPSAIRRGYKRRHAGRCTLGRPHDAVSEPGEQHPLHTA